MPKYGKTIYLAILEDLSEKIKPLPLVALVAMAIILFILTLASLLLLIIFIPVGCIVFIISFYILNAVFFTIHNKLKKLEQGEFKGLGKL
jgi:hypothetical protein